MLIWRGALEAKVVLPDPKDVGYIADPQTGLFTPHMMAQSVAPPELLGDLICLCKDQCSDDCVCSSNEQPCTLVCECKCSLNEAAFCQNLFTMLASVNSDDILE